MKLGTTELLIILAIVVLLFGPSQLPKLTKMFGKSVKNFKSGMEEDDTKETSAEEKASSSNEE